MRAIEYSEPLSRPFWSSVGVHFGIIALLAAAWLRPAPTVDRWGGLVDGAVTVQGIPIIPIPKPDGPEVRIAGGRSPVPAATSPTGTQQAGIRPKDSDGAAIRNKSRIGAPAQPDKWTAQQRYPDRLKGGDGQPVNTPDYGVRIGGVLGSQFGWYASVVRSKIAQAWKVSALSAQAQAAPAATVSFVIRRDGSLAPGLPRIERSSGNDEFDRGAQRAILDGAPFPALPDGFPMAQAAVEVNFRYRP